MMQIIKLFFVNFPYKIADINREYIKSYSLKIFSCGICHCAGFFHHY